MSGEQRIGLALVLMGGAALFWYFALLSSDDVGRRGTGKGSGSSNHAGGSSSGGGRRKGVKVSILAGDRVELEGVPTDLVTTVARVREVGAAEVHVAGAAREGWYQQVRHALQMIPGVELEVHDPAADDPVYLLLGPPLPIPPRNLKGTNDDA